MGAAFADGFCIASKKTLVVLGRAVGAAPSKAAGPSVCDGGMVATTETSVERSGKSMAAAACFS